MVLETWFILAIISAVAAGVGSFLYKVAAKESVDIVLLSFCTAVLSSLIVIVVIAFSGDFSGFWHLMVLFAGINSALFLVTNVTKVKSLENIDAAIFFPLYKVFGPGLVIVVSLLLFSERFTTYEWIGLVLSLCVPFLLLSKAEDGRQTNLRAGLWWLLVTVIISAIGVAAWKHGADIAPNPWTYILAVELTMIPIALVALLQKHRRSLREKFSEAANVPFIKLLLIAGIVHAIAGATFIFALTTGGALGIAYTINSLYILIPIILAIIFYNEHWNLRKAFAIVLSIVALAFFG